MIGSISHRLLVRSAWVMGVCLGVLSVPLNAQNPNCDQWNTEGFFRNATVEDVRPCFRPGRTRWRRLRR